MSARVVWGGINEARIINELADALEAQSREIDRLRMALREAERR